MNFIAKRPLKLTALAFGIGWSLSALSQAPPADRDAQPSDGLDEVIVTGLRGSLESATAKKRNAKQIVDSVVAEDVGKLPDNNVPEALSRVAGVMLDRVHGEGTGVSIRGLTDIQTTINGNMSSVGEQRSTNLADIPAELLKSVEVYKNRTPDQVEGGIAGTVNVELRRPLDLEPGATIAGSVRSVYSDIGKDWSPYTSLLFGERFDTGIGEMGFLVNAAYTKNIYEENFIDSESPAPFFGSDFDSLPPSQQGVYAQYAANYGIERGAIKRPSINLSGQWRASDHLDFVLEGSYFSSEETRSRDRLHLTIRDGNYTLSDVVISPDGRSLQSVTVSNPMGINGGPESYFEQIDSHDYTTNFEAHWQGDSIHFDASAQYNWSDTNNYNILQVMRFKNQTSAHYEANSDQVPGGGPFIDFTGTDIANVANYNLFDFHDEQIFAKAHEFASQADLTFDVSEDGFFRSVKTGLRYSKRNTDREYGYRDGFPNDFNGVDLSSFPDGNQVVESQPHIDGFAPTWLHLPGGRLLGDMDNIRAYLTANANCCSDWTTVKPTLNRGQSFVEDEATLGGYAQLNFGFEMGYPVDGVVGARVVNSKGTFHSTNYRPDPLGGPDITQDAVGKGEYTDVMPSLNATMHFTPQLQMRVGYTYNVERPPLFALRPFAFFETRATPPIVFAGNPELQPNKERSYDLTLEYYFGRAGSISLAAYLKKQNGFIYESGVVQNIPELGTTGTVVQPRNAGPGTFQGFEFAAQGFFEFLPGIWKNFGASVNATYIPKFRIDFPYDDSQRDIPGIFDAPSTSKYTYNTALFYDTPKLSARVAYNYRAKRKDFVNVDFLEYSLYTMETSRLDAALNYTPVKYLTLSLEGTNLLGENTQRYFGVNRYMPVGPRLEAKTIQLGARFRF